MRLKAVGACGKKIDHVCYPDFEDDLCVGCPFNGWTEIQAEMELERDEEILRYEVEGCRDYSQEGSGVQDR